MKRAFCISGKKGFQITAPNGYTLSVQFGPGNYGDNYNRDIGSEDELSGKEGLIPDPADNGEYVDTVQGYQTVSQVLDRLHRMASWPAPADEEKAA